MATKPCIQAIGPGYYCEYSVAVTSGLIVTDMADEKYQPRSCNVPPRPVAWRRWEVYSEVYSRVDNQVGTIKVCMDCHYAILLERLATLGKLDSNV